MLDLRTLREVMPVAFSLPKGKYCKTKAFKMLDRYVLVEHGCMMDSIKNELVWPGPHKNVYFWVELDNGSAVGWNENPLKGWSFPVIKNPYHSSMTIEEWERLVTYNKEIYKC